MHPPAAQGLLKRRLQLPGDPGARPPVRLIQPLRHSRPAPGNVSKVELMLLPSSWPSTRAPATRARCRGTDSTTTTRTGGRRGPGPRAGPRAAAWRPSGATPTLTSPPGILG
jgi:hypothetical protein